MVHKSVSNLSEGPFFKDLVCVFGYSDPAFHFAGSPIADLFSAEKTNTSARGGCIKATDRDCEVSLYTSDCDDCSYKSAKFELEYWLKVIALNELPEDITEKLFCQYFQCDEQQYQDLLHAANAFASAFVKWSLEPYYKDSDIQKLNRHMRRLKKSLNEASAPEKEQLDEDLSFLNTEIISIANNCNIRTSYFEICSYNRIFQDHFSSPNDWPREKELYVKRGFKTVMKKVDEEAYVRWWKRSHGPHFDFFRNFEKTVRLEYRLNEEVRNAYKDLLSEAKFLMPEQHAQERIETLYNRFVNFSALEWYLYLPM